MMSCWSKEPICTSVVIIFWQVYLCRFASVINNTRPEGNYIDPAVMIMRFMPLKADRVLPGHLLKTLKDHGFVVTSQVPKLFKAMPVPNMQPVLPQPALRPMPLAGQPHLAEPPFGIGERVTYWSETK